MWNRFLGLDDNGPSRHSGKHRSLRRIPATTETPRRRRDKRESYQCDEPPKHQSPRSVSFAGDLESSAIIPSGKYSPATRTGHKRSMNTEEQDSYADLVSNIPNQFPNQTPLNYALPYRPPVVTRPSYGEAAEYYGDQGESVAHQPGIRPGTPIVTNAEQHLMPASAVFAPPIETGVGSAADFYASNTPLEHLNVSGQSSNISLASGYALPVQPAQPHKSDTHNSNIAAGALAGVAALNLSTPLRASSAHPTHQLSQHQQFSKPPNLNSPQNKLSFSSSINVMSAVQPRGSVRKLMDWWHDYEDVRKMEEYTEYIGVCRDCFDSDSPVDSTPRKHYQHSGSRRSCKHTAAGEPEHHKSLSSESGSDRNGQNSRSSRATSLGLGAAASILAGGTERPESSKYGSSKPSRQSSHMEKGTISSKRQGKLPLAESNPNVNPASSRDTSSVSPSFTPLGVYTGHYDYRTTEGSSARVEDTEVNKHKKDEHSPRLAALDRRERRTAERSRADNERNSLPGLLGRIFSPATRSSPTSIERHSHRPSIRPDSASLSSVDDHNPTWTRSRRAERGSRRRPDVAGSTLLGFGDAALLAAAGGHDREFLAFRDLRKPLSTRGLSTRTGREHRTRILLTSSDEDWESTSSNDHPSSSVDLNLAFGGTASSDSGSDSIDDLANTVKTHFAAKLPTQDPKAQEPLYQPPSHTAPLSTFSVQRRRNTLDKLSALPAMIEDPLNLTSLKLVHPVPTSDHNSFDAMPIDSRETPIHQSPPTGYISPHAHCTSSKVTLLEPSESTTGNRVHILEEHQIIQNNPHIFGDSSHNPGALHHYDSYEDAHFDMRHPECEFTVPTKSSFSAKIHSPSDSSENEIGEISISRPYNTAPTMTGKENSMQPIRYEERGASNSRSGEPIYDDELYDPNLFTKPTPQGKSEQLVEPTSNIIEDLRTGHSEAPVSMAELFASPELFHSMSTAFETQPLLLERTIVVDTTAHMDNMSGVMNVPLYRLIPRLNIIAPTPPESVVSFRTGDRSPSPAPSPRTFHLGLHHEESAAPYESMSDAVTLVDTTSERLASGIYKEDTAGAVIAVFPAPSKKNSELCTYASSTSDDDFAALDSPNEEVMLVHGTGILQECVVVGVATTVKASGADVGFLATDEHLLHNSLHGFVEGEVVESEDEAGIAAPDRARESNESLSRHSSNHEIDEPLDDDIDLDDTQSVPHRLRESVDAQKVTSDSSSTNYATNKANVKSPGAKAQHSLQSEPPYDELPSCEGFATANPDLRPREEGSIDWSEEDRRAKTTKKATAKASASPTPQTKEPKPADDWNTTNRKKGKGPKKTRSTAMPRFAKEEGNERSDSFHREAQPSDQNTDSLLLTDASPRDESEKPGESRQQDSNDIFAEVSPPPNEVVQNKLDKKAKRKAKRAKASVMPWEDESNPASAEHSTEPEAGGAREVVTDTGTNLQLQASKVNNLPPGRLHTWETPLTLNTSQSENKSRTDSPQPSCDNLNFGTIKSVNRPHSLASPEAALGFIAAALPLFRQLQNEHEHIIYSGHNSAPDLTDSIHTELKHELEPDIVSPPASPQESESNSKCDSVHLSNLMLQPLDLEGALESNLQTVSILHGSGGDPTFVPAALPVFVSSLAEESEVQTEPCRQSGERGSVEHALHETTTPTESAQHFETVTTVVRGASDDKDILSQTTAGLEEQHGERPIGADCQDDHSRNMDGGSKAQDHVSDGKAITMDSFGDAPMAGMAHMGSTKTECDFIAARLPIFSRDFDTVMAAIDTTSSHGRSSLPVYPAPRQVFVRSATDLYTHQGSPVHTNDVKLSQGQASFDHTPLTFTPSSHSSPPVIARSQSTSLQRSVSSTAIPLRFRRPPQSPVNAKVAPIFSAPSPSPSPIMALRARHNRLGSSEFKTSTEFRPLYLVECNTKPPDPEESLPSLPSSRTSSRASSAHENEDVFQSATQSPQMESAQMYTPYEYPFDLTLDTRLANEEAHYLDSAQTTPKGVAFSPTGLRFSLEDSISPTQERDNDSSSVAAVMYVPSVEHRSIPSALTERDANALEASRSFQASPELDAHNNLNVAHETSHHGFVDSSPVAYQADQVRDVTGHNILKVTKALDQIHLVGDDVATAPTQQETVIAYHDQMAHIATSNIANLRDHGAILQSSPSRHSSTSQVGHTDTDAVLLGEHVPNKKREDIEEQGLASHRDFAILETTLTHTENRALSPIAFSGRGRSETELLTLPDSSHSNASVDAYSGDALREAKQGSESVTLTCDVSSTSELSSIHEAILLEALTIALPQSPSGGPLQIKASQEEFHEAQLLAQTPSIQALPNDDFTRSQSSVTMDAQPTQTVALDATDLHCQANLDELDVNIKASDCITKATNNEGMCSVLTDDETVCLQTTTNEESTLHSRHVPPLSGPIQNILITPLLAEHVIEGITNPEDLPAHMDEDDSIADIVGDCGISGDEQLTQNDAVKPSSSSLSIQHVQEAEPYIVAVETTQESKLETSVTAPNPVERPLPDDEEWNVPSKKKKASKSKAKSAPFASLLISETQDNDANSNELETPKSRAFGVADEERTAPSKEKTKKQKGKAQILETLPDLTSAQNEVTSSEHVPQPEDRARPAHDRRENSKTAADDSPPEPKLPREGTEDHDASVAVVRLDEDKLNSALQEKNGTGSENQSQDKNEQNNSGKNLIAIDSARVYEQDSEKLSSILPRTDMKEEQSSGSMGQQCEAAAHGNIVIGNDRFIENTDSMAAVPSPTSLPLTSSPVTPSPASPSTKVVPDFVLVSKPKAREENPLLNRSKKGKPGKKAKKSKKSVAVSDNNREEEEEVGFAPAPKIKVQPTEEGSTLQSADQASQYGLEQHRPEEVMALIERPTVHQETSYKSDDRNFDDANLSEAIKNMPAVHGLEQPTANQKIESEQCDQGCDQTLVEQERKEILDAHHPNVAQMALPNQPLNAKPTEDSKNGRHRNTENLIAEDTPVTEVVSNTSVGAASTRLFGAINRLIAMPLTKIGLVHTEGMKESTDTGPEYTQTTKEQVIGNNTNTLNEATRVVAEAQLPVVPFCKAPQHDEPLHSEPLHDEPMYDDPQHDKLHEAISCETSREALLNPVEKHLQDISLPNLSKQLVQEKDVVEVQPANMTKICKSDLSAESHESVRHDTTGARIWSTPVVDDTDARSGSSPPHVFVTQLDDVASRIHDGTSSTPHDAEPTNVLPVLSLLEVAKHPVSNAISPTQASGLQDGEQVKSTTYHIPRNNIPWLAPTVPASPSLSQAEPADVHQSSNEQATGGANEVQERQTFEPSPFINQRNNVEGDGASFVLIDSQSALSTRLEPLPAPKVNVASCGVLPHDQGRLSSTFEPLVAIPYVLTLVPAISNKVAGLTRLERTDTNSTTFTGFSNNSLISGEKSSGDGDMEIGQGHEPGVRVHDIESEQPPGHASALGYEPSVDVEFAATVAAGLHEAGFDTNMFMTSPRLCESPATPSSLSTREVDKMASSEHGAWVSPPASVGNLGLHDRSDQHFLPSRENEMGDGDLDFQEIVGTGLESAGFTMDTSTRTLVQMASNSHLSKSNSTGHKRTVDNDVDFVARSPSPKGPIAAWNASASDVQSSNSDRKHLAGSPSSWTSPQYDEKGSVHEQQQAQNPGSSFGRSDPTDGLYERSSPSVREDEFAESLTRAAVFMDRHANTSIIDAPSSKNNSSALKRSKAKRGKHHKTFPVHEPIPEASSMRELDDSALDRKVSTDELAAAMPKSILESPIDAFPERHAQISDHSPAIKDEDDRDEEHIAMPGFQNSSPTSVRVHETTIDAGVSREPDHVSSPTSLTTESMPRAYQALTLPAVAEEAEYYPNGVNKMTTNGGSQSSSTRAGQELELAKASGDIAASPTGVRRVTSGNVVPPRILSPMLDVIKRGARGPSPEYPALDTRRIGSPASSVASNQSGVLRRRSDNRSASGDLRAASRRDDPQMSAAGASLDLATSKGAPPPPLQQGQLEGYHPLKGNGKDRCQQDMSDNPIPVGDAARRNGHDASDAVQDIWRSSPRPQGKAHPTLRKWDSMQIIDLENRLEQVLSENRSLQDTLTLAESKPDLLSRELRARDSALHEKEVAIQNIRTSVQVLKQDLFNVTERNDELTVANRNLSEDTNGRYAVLQVEHDQTRRDWQLASRELEDLRQRYDSLAAGMETAVRQAVNSALAHKDVEIQALQTEMADAREQISLLQQQILASKQGDSFLQVRDEDHFDSACHRLCQHVQQWVLRFSKFSDTRACRMSSELRDEQLQKRLDNAILDGSDVDNYLSDRTKRRDVFTSVVMTMIWEFVFTRYLFGMDREQRSKLKGLEKTLVEVGMYAFARLKNGVLT